MNKKIVVSTLLALSVPVVLLATVDIGGQAVGGPANSDISNVGSVFASFVSASSVFASSVSAATTFGGHVTANSVSVGSTNTATTTSAAIGISNFVSSMNSLAVGYNLDITFDQSTLVVGEFNEEKSGILLGVGNGDSETNRKNAFEVHYDGKVIINEEQGDIPMFQP